MTRTTVSRRTIAKGTAWAAPVLATASTAPALAISCNAKSCSTAAATTVLNFGGALTANGWSVGYQSYVGPANPINGTTYSGSAPAFITAGSDSDCGDNGGTTTPPINSDNGQGGTPYGGITYSGTGWTPQGANGTSMGCAKIGSTNYTTTGNTGVTGAAVIANGDVIAPVSTTKDSTGNSTTSAYAATISYTSACVCLGPGTYTIRTPWSIWNGGYRSITIWMIAIPCAGGNKVNLLTSNPTVAPVGWTKGIVQPGPNGTYVSRCDGNYQGPPDATTISNASGTAVGSLKVTTATQYRFSYVFAYGPNQLCYCGCRSRSNQAAIGQPTITCA